jgi:hypothetical protein
MAPSRLEHLCLIVIVKYLKRNPRQRRGALTGLPKSLRILVERHLPRERIRLSPIEFLAMLVFNGVTLVLVITFLALLIRIIKD